MIRKILISICLIIFIVGCTEKKDEKKTDNSVNEKIPLKIEVEENKNAKEIKVMEKEKTGTQKEESYYLSYNIKNEYNPNSQPANKDAAVRVKPRTNIEANMNIRSPYEKVKISLLVKKLSKNFIVRCSACHNDYANGIIGPSLLDKDSKFIYQSIMEFRKDNNKNVLMSDLVNQMDEKEIKEISDEIYEFNKNIRNLK